MEFKDFELCQDIVRAHTDKLRKDVEKLKAVDDLIGESATAEKKDDLLNTIFVLQDIESKILSEMQKKLGNETMTRP